MSIPQPSDWTFELIQDKDHKSEFFTFQRLTIDHCQTSADVITCQITSQVFEMNGSQPLSDVTGTFRFFVASGIALMDLAFHLRKPDTEILLSGSVRNGNSFNGRFLAHQPNFTRDAGLRRTGVGDVNPDVGETGTGTGNQTLIDVK